MRQNLFDMKSDVGTIMANIGPKSGAKTANIGPKSGPGPPAEAQELPKTVNFTIDHQSKI